MLLPHSPELTAFNRSSNIYRVFLLCGTKKFVKQSKSVPDLFSLVISWRCMGLLMSAAFRV